VEVYRKSTGELVLGKYPGKQSPFVTGLCGSRAATVIRQQAVYSVERLEILRPPFFSRKSSGPKMALTFLVQIIERLYGRTSSISRVPLS
jgi:hypothetical protein